MGPSKGPVSLSESLIIVACDGVSQGRVIKPMRNWKIVLGAVRVHCECDGEQHVAKLSQRGAQRRHARLTPSFKPMLLSYIASHMRTDDSAGTPATTPCLLEARDKNLIRVLQ